MANLALVFPVLIAILTALAIYVQVTASDLSLPLSTGTTVLTIVLPLLAVLNVSYTPVLQRLLSRPGTSPILQQLVPPTLQLVQFALTVVLATLTSEGFAPGSDLNCSLETRWQRLWRSHDGRAIERIQDSFNCCGFNSVKDRTWPREGCQDMYRRHSSCVGPWRASMQRISGIEFSVAVAVGILQMIHLALFKLRNARRSTATGYKRLTQSVGADPSERLLGDGQVEVEEEGTVGNGGSDSGHRDYGAIEERPSPRVEPSGLVEERNNWAS
ncbi:hypothetical protein F4778DRAFT_784170 [Xylariomycetidae sp. FL2044]|nr:hypothetical protein F4778DRAFT_784170 [Xylariomycetidae sp. FL2044]